MLHTRAAEGRPADRARRRRRWTRAAAVAARGGSVPRGTFGAGIDAAIERAPSALTARTPAHSSSSWRLSVHRVTSPSGTTCSQVADVVLRISSS